MSLPGVRVDSIVALPGAGARLKPCSVAIGCTIDARDALVQTGGMIRIPNVALLALLTLVLSGCGFHLRHALTLPEDLGPVRVVSADRYSPLGTSLAQALTRIGATPASPDAVEDVATLEVISERWGSRPISIDQFGRAQEFSLRYAVVFGLRKGDGSDVLPRQVIELSRDYISSPTNPTGAESEQELLSRELRREMVAQILRRIDAVEQEAQSAPPLPAAVEQPPAPDVVEPQSPADAVQQPAPSDPVNQEPQP